MSADSLLAALDPEQRAVATALRGPVCVLAGAGTGKTRAITHRIAYGIATGVYKPQHVLAVTFTARAAGEMRTRLRGLGASGVQARTFHSAALRQLGFFWPKVVGGAPPRLAEAKAPLVADAARRVGIAADRTAVRDLAAEIEWAKVSLVVPDDYAKAVAAVDRPVPADLDPQALARLIAAYEQVKDERGVIDFEDVLLLLAAMLAERGDVAGQVRDQYKHFVVDEYQDVSPLQQYLLDQWLGGRHELCVVGDPSQTIYSFAGASPHHLTQFRRMHPGAQVVRLVRDYRSTPQVVSLANRIIDATRTAGGPAPLELRAQRPDGPQVQWAAYDDDESEARGIAHAASALIAAGTRASEIAVLYRTNAQSEAFEEALAAAGVPYQVRGGARFFARRDVREAIVFLRGGARAADPEVPMPQTARDLLRNAGWSEQAPPTRGAAREKWEALDALARLADDLARSSVEAGRPPATVLDLVAELDERAAAQHAPTVEGVTLASLHAAKGLEWDAVFLSGLSEGLLPSALSRTADEIAEERRLLYVGVTRAREHLQLSYARARLPGARASRSPSRFLVELWPGAAARGPARRAGTNQAAVRPGPSAFTAGRAGGRGSGVSVGAASGGEPDHAADGRTRAVVDALEAWRSARAIERGVPAGRVLAPHLVRAIAESCPATLEELAAVRGIGPMLLASSGEDLLRAVRDATTAVR